MTGCVNHLHTLDQAYTLKSSRWVFTDVNIVDVTHGEIITNMDVFVDDGVINKIVKRDTKATNGYQIIQAKDLFLSPGLIDSHVHIYSERDLIFYVANGVTGVQNMWGFEGMMTLLGLPNSLDLKRRISNWGFGPMIWTSGPIFEGEKKTHPFMSSFIDKASAEEEVERQQQLRYDFIKTYDWLSNEAFSAIILKANAQNIPVKGHVPYSVSIHDAIESGLAEVEHLTGWIDIDSATINVAENKLDEISILARNKNISVCPSLLVFRRVMSQERAEEELVNHSYRRYLSSIDKWMENQGASSMRDNVKIPLENYPDMIAEVQERVLLNLLKNNVNIVACTDAGNPFVYPGVSLHEEMSLLQAAGISPDKILQMATIKGQFNRSLLLILFYPKKILSKIFTI